MEFSVIRHLILCEVLISPVLGILATCLSPAVRRGETATIACRFHANINALQKEFQVDRYSLDPSDSLVETVLFCYWINGKRICKTANGYEYDEFAIDQVNIIVPNARAKHAGRYACQTVPSEPGEIQSCNLYIIGNLATCLSPAVLTGETAKITCHFEADINALQKEFQVKRYSFHPSDSLVETVLFCYWINGKRICKTANGYEYDDSVIDQFNITVPNARAKHAGRYACQTVPSELGEIQSCNLYIKGISATCLSPAILRGDTANITCHFKADINALHKDFYVKHYSFDKSLPLKETVLFCHWFNGKRICKTANGYEYDESVIDQVNIKIPNAMVKHAGRYACWTIPSEQGDAASCSMYIIEPPEGYKIAVIVLASVIGVLAIGLFIFITYQRIQMPQWLKKKFNISQDVPGTSNDKEKSRPQHQFQRKFSK